MSDVFSVLAADHDRIFALASQLTGGTGVPQGTPEERKAIANELVMELSRHEVTEEMLLWPAVRDRVDDGGQICQTALDQEHVGKRVLNELVHVSAGSEEFGTLADTLAAHLREHISYEQNIVWPKLRLRLSDSEAARLGAGVEQAKRRAPTRPHPHVPPESRLLRKVAPAAAALDKARNTLIRWP